MDAAEHTWSPLLKPLLPADDEVLLALATLDLSGPRIQQLSDTLSPDEIDRADRFATEELHNRWVACRGLLRELLGALLGAAPERLRFLYGSHGKPLVDPDSVPAQQEPRLTFNVSHSRDHALFALARGREVGVDLESIRERNSDGVADRFFTPDESAALRALDDESERRRAFFSLWSAKEAFIKATGLGLSQSLASFGFELARVSVPGARERAPGLVPVQLRWHRDDPRASESWRVHALAPNDEFAAALVTAGNPRTLSLRVWNAARALPLPETNTGATIL